MAVLKKCLMQFFMAVLGFIPASSYSYTLKAFTSSHSVIQCPSVVVGEALVTADGVDRAYRMSVGCSVKRNITGPPWKWDESSLVADVRASYNTGTQEAVWRADYSAQGSDGFHSGKIVMIYRCAVDPFFDDGVPNHCVFQSLSDSGHLITHVDSFPPGKDSIPPDMLVSKSAEAPPPPPGSKHSLTDKIGETAGVNPALTSKRIRVVSPLKDEVVTADEVLFQVDEASLKNSDGEWRFGNELCCLLELQYKAHSNKTLNIPHKWITVAKEEYLDHGETLAGGKNRSRNKLADWAVDILKGTDLGSRNVMAALENGGRARGEWRWRAKVLLRDGANYDSLWREFRIMDSEDMQTNMRMESSQSTRQ